MPCLGLQCGYTPLSPLSRRRGTRHPSGALTLPAGCHRGETASGRRTSPSSEPKREEPPCHDMRRQHTSRPRDARGTSTAPDGHIGRGAGRRHRARRGVRRRLTECVRRRFGVWDHDHRRPDSGRRVSFVESTSRARLSTPLAYERTACRTSPTRAEASLAFPRVSIRARRSSKQHSKPARASFPAEGPRR